MQKRPLTVAVLRLVTCVVLSVPMGLCVSCGTTSPPPAEPLPKAPVDSTANAVNPAHSGASTAGVSANTQVKDAGIVPSTKRGASGLPDPLPDYASWPIRKPSQPDEPGGITPHLSFRQGYIAYPQGKKVEPPFPAGTTIVIEEKADGKDFIGQITSLTKGEKDWKPEIYNRRATTEPFAAADASRCVSCHRGEVR